MIDAHRGVFEYEWRARFHLPLSVVGRSMSWGEAVRLTQVLSQDPTSQIAAALSEWGHVTSWEALALYDLYDLTHEIGWKQLGGKGQRPKPYPRPWVVSDGSHRAKPDAALTQDQIIAALRAAGHTAPIPDAHRR